MLTFTVRAVNSVPLTVSVGRLAVANDSTPDAEAVDSSMKGLSVIRMSSRKLPKLPGSVVMNWTRWTPDGPE